MIRDEIIKFVVVGIINTIFYYMLYSLFIYMNFEYFLAVIFATILGVLFSFKTFSKLVFNNSNNKLIFKFLLVYCFNIVLNIFIIKAYVYFCNDNLYIAGLIAIILIAISSFVLNKFYVFKIYEMREN